MITCIKPGVRSTLNYSKTFDIQIIPKNLLYSSCMIRPGLGLVLVLIWGLKSVHVFETYRDINPMLSEEIDV